MSRVVTISAISTRGGASRMSMPDGSRHMMSTRSCSRMRSVGRLTMLGATAGTRSRPRRSLNWSEPSTRQTLWSCPRPTARLYASVVRPTPPLGEKSDTISEPARDDSTARVSPTLRIMVVRSKPVNGILRTASIPRSGFSVTGFCGTVSMITPTCGSALRISSATCCPLTRPWSRASTITTSGLISATLAAARSPEVTTSSILIWDWALSSDRTCDAT